MAIIYNSQLTKELVDVGKLQVSRDRIPNEIAEKVVPVIDVNPKHSRVCNIVRGNGNTISGAAIVYVTPADKDFYLVQANVACEKDVLSDNQGFWLSVVIDGATQLLCYTQSLSLTATHKEFSACFNPPIKIDRGTNISINGTFAAGGLSKSAEIVGYTVDNINA